MTAAVVVVENTCVGDAVQRDAALSLSGACEGTQGEKCRSGLIEFHLFSFFLGEVNYPESNHY
ncbi:MAG TPA: hypothetical protein VL689_16180 [Paraburkholderia sp.]|nr:hypothetical protein [Paraburkholderia sp.]